MALVFIYFKKVFDFIYPTHTAEANTSQVDEKPYINLFNIYKTAKTNITKDDLNPEFTTTKGVRQGETISPKLFKATPGNIFRILVWHK